MIRIRAASRPLLLAFATACAIAVISFWFLDLRHAAVSCLLGWTMLAIAVVDFEDFIIPDTLSLPAIPLGLIAARLLDDPNGEQNLLLEHVAAAAAGFTILYAIKQIYYWSRKREGLGLGDVKLASAAGAWTGLEGLSHVLLLACILAMSYVAVANIRTPRAIERMTAIPFGVFLGPAIWIVWCISAIVAGPETTMPLASRL
ncbi:A24 family peptidase [Hyphomicrobium sp.]|jgi:leader peptidase (prepilin peptidase)/N-methyltransferase|uniref:prepilin peptidase n=1 Tax=Hyphomicrobium sp. TaxID=82 RepID=UPI002BDFF678|nr:A24 family peptidase [Hyphomicrobium sp.]HVZ05795.1 A24 family peptidase [Hyphomicrobium sp.]